MAATGSLGTVDEFTLTEVQAEAGPVSAFAVRCRVPSTSATQIMLESSFEILIGKPGLLRVCGKVCISEKVIALFVLWRSRLPFVCAPVCPPTTYARLPFGSNATLLI